MSSPRPPRRNAHDDARLAAELLLVEAATLRAHDAAPYTLTAAGEAELERAAAIARHPSGRAAYVAAMTTTPDVDAQVAAFADYLDRHLEGTPTHGATVVPSKHGGVVVHITDLTTGHFTGEHLMVPAVAMRAGFDVQQLATALLSRHRYRLTAPWRLTRSGESLALGALLVRV